MMDPSKACLQEHSQMFISVKQKFIDRFIYTYAQRQTRIFIFYKTKVTVKNKPKIAEDDVQQT